MLSYRKLLIPMNIQFHADEPSGNGGSGEGAGGNGGGGVSFDDMLKDKAYQAEFDRRINKALETARGKWEAEKTEAVNAAKSEAEKLAKMTAEQRAAHESAERIKQLEQRERDITTRELRAQALDALRDKELPSQLGDLLNYSSAEACSKSIEAVEAAFRGAVQSGVESRMKGKTPTTGTGVGMTDERMRQAFGLKTK